MGFLSATSIGLASRRSRLAKVVRHGRTLRQSRGCSRSVMHVEPTPPSTKESAAVREEEYTPPAGEGRVNEASEEIYDFVSRCKTVTFLTGAGFSTASGIPDYRSPLGSYSRGHRPMKHDAFTRNVPSRKRYWGRSMIGYGKFASRKPNDGHFALAELERRGLVEGVVTQNVDGLHGIAGSKDVLELHGRGHYVKCMNCGAQRARSEYTEELRNVNDAWMMENAGRLGAAMRPDGDIDLEVDFSELVIPPCWTCGTGVVKPDVVFFGDHVPLERRTKAEDMINNANGLIVAGSSLQVYSAYSLVLAAIKASIPLVILNIGETRADKNGLKSLRLSERCDIVLPEVASMFAKNR